MELIALWALVVAVLLLSKKGRRVLEEAVTLFGALVIFAIVGAVLIVGITLLAPYFMSILGIAILAMFGLALYHYKAVARFISS